MTLADLIQEQDLEFHIQVNLTRPVLITQIGSSGFSNGFVNNFTLLYEGRAGNTSIYTQWNLHHEQVCHKDSCRNMHDFVLTT